MMTITGIMKELSCLKKYFIFGLFLQIGAMCSLSILVQCNHGH